MNKETVFNKAVELARANGIINLSRRGVSEAAGIPDGSFPHVTGQTFAEMIEDVKTAIGPETEVHEVNKSRVNDPELRQRQILDAAISLATTKGYDNITRDEVAIMANVSDGLVTRYFAAMPALKHAVMRAAVEREIPEIIAQGLANGDDQARRAPQKLKEKAIGLLTKI